MVQAGKLFIGNHNITHDLSEDDKERRVDFYRGKILRVDLGAMTVSVDSRARSSL